MMGLPLLHYGAIYADPPWRFETWSEKGSNRSADRHYATMSDAEIAALPIGHLASRDCVLFLWVLDCKIPAALTMIGRWGFEYVKVAFVWEKTDAQGGPRMSTGYWTRNGAELCLMATCGNPRPKSRGVRQVLRARPRQHSRKPDVFRTRIEQLVEGPYVELFARSRTPGWDAWGNQVEKFGDAA